VNSAQRQQEIIDLTSRHVNPALARLMSFAGFSAEATGRGCWITDVEGRRFLDCLGGYGVFSFGHSHPKIIQAVKEQLDLMPLSGKAFFNEGQGRLAAKLASLAPGDLEYAFFCSSGAEAVEAALKFARAATGRSGFVSTLGGYHGKTMGALSVTGREKYRKPFEPMVPGATFVPFGDTEALFAAVSEETAAIILEPIQGEGGIHLPPDGYLASAREAANRVGALLIFDEVQTGLGRTGEVFGCQHEGVAPDLMTLAKALGGGVMPLGACLGTGAIWDKVFGENPLAHTSTFGGNPLACAAGLAALDVLENEDLCAKSRIRGAQMLEGLSSIASPLIKEARGRGLMIGVEFQFDEVGELVIAQMLKRGVAAAYTLNNPRVIRFEPPLIITEEEVNHAIAMFAEAVQETQALLAELGVMDFSSVG
jgi:putrescine aminotransferase